MELKREHVTDTLDTIDPGMDPTMTMRAIENAEFDTPDVTEQDSHENRMSEHPGNQDQDMEYEIII